MADNEQDKSWSKPELENGWATFEKDADGWVHVKPKKPAIQYTTFIIPPGYKIKSPPERNRD